ncbi:MAG TPA: hypothetical protein DCS23_00005 [Candidatus Yonathbacteria bacterium]|nr:hypothetical protein [Candidatus Yonathbacteria bacterium]
MSRHNIILKAYQKSKYFPKPKSQQLSAIADNCWDLGLEHIIKLAPHAYFVAALFKKGRGFLKLSPPLPRNLLRGGNIKVNCKRQK